MTEKEIALWAVGAVASIMIGLLVKRVASGLLTAALEFPKLAGEVESLKKTLQDGIDEIKKETDEIPLLVSDVSTLKSVTMPLPTMMVDLQRLKNHDFHGLREAVHTATLRLQLREKEMDRAIDRLDRLEDTVQKTQVLATETNTNVKALMETVGQVTERLSKHLDNNEKGQ